MADDNRILGIEELEEILREDFRNYWFPAIAAMFFDGLIPDGKVSSVEIEEYMLSLGGEK